MAVWRHMLGFGAALIAIWAVTPTVVVRMFPPPDYIVRHEWVNDQMPPVETLDDLGALVRELQRRSQELHEGG